MLSGRLPRPVHLNEDEDEIDYEIEECRIRHRPSSSSSSSSCRECDRVVAITLPKAVPMDGMTIWWDRPLVGYPRIDVTAIRGRGVWGRGRGGGGGGGATTTREDDGRKDEGREGGGGEEASFYKAWEEAHETFRKKAKTRERQVIED
ncbi:hypothetical protein ACHAW5_004518 [Stephanodiscus triporus]